MERERTREWLREVDGEALRRRKRRGEGTRDEGETLKVEEGVAVRRGGTEKQGEKDRCGRPVEEPAEEDEREAEASSRRCRRIRRGGRSELAEQEDGDAGGERRR